MFRKIFFSFCFVFFSLSILAMEEETQTKNNKIIIYIHGLSFPEPHHPCIDFFKKTKELSNIDINQPGKFGRYKLEAGSSFAKLATHTFYWARTEEQNMDGILSKKGRYEAAQYLFKDLTENPDYKNKEISIFAHSHGGNVATELLRVIGKEKSQLKIKNLIFYETPKGELTERGIHTKVNNSYVAEQVFDINLDYQPNYWGQQQGKATQVIDIFHQFPRCFRTFLKKRDNLQDILLDGKCLNHNSIEHIKDLVSDLLNEHKIKENYSKEKSPENPYIAISFNTEIKESFHANNPIFQYFCYYILPHVITCLQATIIYKLLMRYDKKYNLGIKKNLIYQINLLKNKYKNYS